MKPFVLTSCAILLALPLAAQAERADALKKVHIDFADVRADDVAQMTAATGHVVISRGTMVLEADRASRCWSAVTIRAAAIGRRTDAAA